MFNLSDPTDSWKHECYMDALNIIKCQLLVLGYLGWIIFSPFTKNVVIWLTPMKGVVTEFGLSHVFDIKVTHCVCENW